MKVDVNATGVTLEPGMREMAERAVLLALGPFAPTLEGVRVRIGEAGFAAPLPGPQYMVMLRVQSEPGFLVIERDEVLSAALKRAAQRARRALERVVSRASMSGAALSGEHAVGGRRLLRRRRTGGRSGDDK